MFSVVWRVLVAEAGRCRVRFPSEKGSRNSACGTQSYSSDVFLSAMGSEGAPALAPWIHHWGNEGCLAILRFGATPVKRASIFLGRF